MWEEGETRFVEEEWSMRIEVEEVWRVRGEVARKMDGVGGMAGAGSPTCITREDPMKMLTNINISIMLRPDIRNPGRERERGW